MKRALLAAAITLVVADVALASRPAIAAERTAGTRHLGQCEGIPNAVGRDLRVCGARPAYVRCGNGRTLRRRSRPRNCNTLRPRQPFAAAVNLARLRWSGWGRPAATARGIERGFHRPLRRIPVRVRAYRLREGCGGALVYTRLRVSSRYGRITVRQAAGCD